MTTHMTKTWFDGKNIITQEIPEAEIYKREWVGLTEEERNALLHLTITHSAIEFGKAIEDKLREKNT
jgi:hypothetical protein